MTFSFILPCNSILIVQIMMIYTHSVWCWAAKSERVRESEWESKRAIGAFANMLLVYVEDDFFPHWIKRSPNWLMLNGDDGQMEWRRVWVAWCVDYWPSIAHSTESESEQKKWQNLCHTLEYGWPSTEAPAQRQKRLFWILLAPHPQSINTL